MASNGDLHYIITQIKGYFSEKVDRSELGDAASKAVANNITTTAAGSVLDARQGKVLSDKVTSLNDSLANLFLINDSYASPAFGKDFLNVNRSDVQDKINQRISFQKPADSTEWSNYPSDVASVQWIGYREVSALSASWVIVTIFEHYPTAGRIWVNTYGGGVWGSWKQITAATEDQNTITSLTSLTSGGTNITVQNVSIDKKSGRITGSFRFSFASSPTSSGYITIATLPEGFYPRRQTYLAVVSNSGSSQSCYISAAGAVLYYATAAVSTSDIFVVQLGYVAS